MQMESEYLMTISTLYYQTSFSGKRNTFLYVSLFTFCFMQPNSNKVNKINKDVFENPFLSSYFLCCAFQRSTLKQKS